MKLNYPEVIIEFANFHGGYKKTLISAIDICKKFKYKNKSIKLQVFSPDGLSAKDFKAYNLYKKLYFSPEEWEYIIHYANNDLKIWLDIFDTYSVSILEKHLTKIKGIKLQASVLENLEVFERLSDLNISKLALILNISGFNINHIKDIIAKFKRTGFKEIIIQVGHQSYPTKISDSGLQKITTIKQALNNDICLADHLDANNVFATILPIIGLSMGANLIEKHICIKRANTKYDFYSALEPKEFNALFENIHNYLLATQGDFISKSEQKYLDDSIQIPMTKNNIDDGTLISSHDIIFRRTSQKGLKHKDIIDLQQNKFILKNSILKNHSIKESYFKKARIGVLVAGRLKSSRLKRKAVLNIDGISSIERCLEQCLKMTFADVVILSTSNNDEDSELKNYTLNNKVKFNQGDADDVISRHLIACDKYNLDVIIHLTADCPVVSYEIAEYLLNSHFKTGADYTSASKISVGTGSMIVNVSALKKVIKHFGKAQYSEYMPWYFKSNPKYFKLNIVNIPKKFIRNYRLTLDYQEDLDMFEQLFIKLNQKQQQATITNIFNILDNDKDIVNINNHLTLKYETDKNLIALLDRETKIK